MIFIGMKNYFAFANHELFALHKSLIDFSRIRRGRIIFIVKFSSYFIQIWIFNRMNGMQQEIDQLKSDAAEMKKNMGFDDELFDDLGDFDKEVSGKSENR